MAYYPVDQVAVRGEATKFERPTDERNRFQSFFCPTCGSTVYVKADKHPTMIGVPVGAIADPAFQAPLRSVWEQTKHKWVSLPAAIQHFPRGRG